MTWADGSRGRTSIYVRAPVEDLRKNKSVLDNAEDFIFKAVEKKIRDDGTAF